MADVRESVRTRMARRRDIPRAYVGLAVIYVLLRVVAIMGTRVAGFFPDTATYRQGVGTRTYPFVSLTGHAMRPWVPPLLFAILPSDNVRSVAQVVLSIGAWLTLAITVALALRDRRVRIGAFVVVLAFSCTTVITSWDRIIGAESTAISFAVLAVAAWIRFTKGPTALNGIAVVAATTLWSFTKSGVFLVVALAALIVLVSLVVGAHRRLRTVVAVVLVFVAVWGAVANARSDTEYERYNAQGLSQFSGNFATLLRLQILNDPEETAWFVDHGMPDPAGLRAYRLRTPVDGSWASGEQGFLRAYRARHDLTYWVDTDGRRTYSRYLATHPVQVADDFRDALPYLLVPPRSDVVYITGPRELLTAFARNLFFATSAGPHLPRAIFGDVGLLLAACVVLIVLAWRRQRDSRLLAVAGASFGLALVTIGLGWVLSPIEIVRHAIPATIVLRLALWIAVFALVDALVSRDVSATSASAPADA